MAVRVQFQTGAMVGTVVLAEVDAVMVMIVAWEELVAVIQEAEAVVQLAARALGVAADLTMAVQVLPIHPVIKQETGRF